MRSLRLARAEGNAVVEFVAFALLALVPVSSFAVSSSLEWLAKAELQSSAALLARAYAIGGEVALSEQQDHLRSQDIQVSTTVLNGVVTVTVRDSALTATARSVE